MFKTTYPNIDISVLVYCVLVVGWKTSSESLTGFLKYLPKNKALLVRNLWSEKNCQNPFRPILRRKKKFFSPLSREEGGLLKALVDRSNRTKYVLNVQRGIWRA